jgi:hypothetical protein
LISERETGQAREVSRKTDVLQARDEDADREGAEGDSLAPDADEAGYRWAEREGLTQPSDCPSFPAAFRDGCEAYAKEQQTTR